MNSEIWKIVPDTDGRYEVSSHGGVRSVGRQFEVRGRWGDTIRVLKPKTMKARAFPNGYGYVHLSLESGVKVCLIHRLVAEAFIGSVDGQQVNHKDGIRMNNVVDNLEIVSCSENIRHAHTLPWRKKHELIRPVAAALPEGPGVFESLKAFVRYLDSVGISRCPGTVRSAVTRGHLCAGLPVWAVTNG